MEQAGFEVIDAQQLRPHYPLTLRAWIERLEANHEAAAAAASETDYRVWRAYMAGSVRGFETGGLGVVQLLGSKGADLPLDRSWMRRDGQPPRPPGDAPSRPLGADERGAGRRILDERPLERFRGTKKPRAWLQRARARG